jgi:hypothetical protein
MRHRHPDSRVARRALWYQLTLLSHSEIWRYQKRGYMRRKETLRPSLSPRCTLRRLFTAQQSEK